MVLLFIHRARIFWCKFQPSLVVVISLTTITTAMPSLASRSNPILTIAHQDQVENNHIISRIFDIGIYDWKAPDHQGGGNQPSVPICYAAVLGSQLLKLVDVLSDHVSCRPSLLMVQKLIERFPSVIKTRFGVARRTNRRSLCCPGWIGSSRT